MYRKGEREGPRNTFKQFESNEGFAKLTIDNKEAREYLENGNTYKISKS